MKKVTPDEFLNICDKIGFNEWGKSLREISERLTVRNGLSNKKYKKRVKDEDIISRHGQHYSKSRTDENIGMAQKEG